MPARKKDTTDKTQAKTSKAKAESTETQVTKGSTGRKKAATVEETTKPKKTAKGKANGPSLVIVESPAKAKTIQKYLGAGFEVSASYGHVRDLPPKPRGNNIGIDIEAGWVPTYQLLDDDRHKKVMSDLKKLSSKASMVYLAPDPDREGEAIAWHLKEALNLSDDRILRVTFNEITKNAIQEAFKNPGDINMDLVKAQEARRFLDRAVGYKLSPLLRKKIGKRLSAGRVQSVAVRLIVEREREIEAFNPEEYWKIISHLTPEVDGQAKVELRIVKKKQDEKQEDDIPEEGDGNDNSNQTNTGMKPTSGKSFLAELNEWKGAKFKVNNEETATEIGKTLEKAAYSVSKVEQKDSIERPKPPFTTSNLQQQASIRLRKSAKDTMKIAQELYEGIKLGSEGPVGLITYMRTDSTRVSNDALSTCRDHIQNEYGNDYLPEKPNAYASGKSAQEAHEAIRPTDINNTPENVRPYLTDPQYQIYSLIFNAFVASQMKPAIFAVTNVEVKAGDGTFKAQGRILKFDGYRKVFPPKGKQEDFIMPSLKEGQDLSLLDLQASQHFTQPPPRYNEASLVKTLEKEGIGRPSTYASILEKIKERRYVELINRRFFATKLGMVVTDKLVAHFPNVMDLKFTNQMESELDQIENQETEWKAVLDKFWGPFSKALETAQESMEAVKEKETGENCPKCGKPLVFRYSPDIPSTELRGCSGFPDCKYGITGDGRVLISEEETDIDCPTCGKKMMKKSSSLGPSLACSDKECKTTMKFDANNNPILASKPTKHVCDKCGKPMVMRQGPRGWFLGCSGYPKCRNLKEVDADGNPVKPVDLGIKCEKCQSPMHVKRGPRGPFMGCSNYPKCRSTKRLTDEQREQVKDLLPPPPPKEALPNIEIDGRCPDCDAPMELRKGRFGLYLVCSKFEETKCKGNRKLTPEIKDKLQML